MSPANITAFCAFIMTVLALYLLGFYTFIPPWAVFIAWACFFHMGGGTDRTQALVATISHMSLGAFSAWLSALALLNNPFTHTAGNTLFGPILIGAAIALLARMSTFSRFSVTPAVIYGYAGVFAFVSMPDAFSMENLLAWSFSNAVITIPFCIVSGAIAGFLNAMLAELLLNFRWEKSVRTKST